VATVLDVNLFDLKGASAVVTGASSGCGVTIARALAAAGAKVVIGARRTEKLEEVARGIRDEGGAAVPVRCDVTSSSDVEALIETACERHGRIDVMVNNAGRHAGPGIMPERLSDELATENLTVNLLGAWYGCKHAGMRMLRDGGGSIINIGSAGGAGGWPDQTPLYGASKAGIVNMSQTLAASWGDRGVRVNTIVLGFFPSEMSKHFLSDPAGVEFAKEHIALRRVAITEELIGPILFLASRASSYVTGASIAVDGGITATLGHCMPQRFYDVLAQQPDGVGTRIEPNGRTAG
jgi:NAD(P)-dependent dehydrogenase (short-subunit alcohol dehydrogenase family)